MSLAQDRCTQTCPRRDKQLIVIKKDGVRRPLFRYCANRNVDQVQSSKRGGRLASLPFPSCTLASDDPDIGFLWRFHTIHKVPSHQPEVCFFNVPSNLLPLILFLDPPLCRLACRLSAPQDSQSRSAAGPPDPQHQLLTSALRRHSEFHIATCPMDILSILHAVTSKIPSIA